MSHISVESPFISQKQQHYIDQQVNQLAPYFGNIDDDLPIFDIILDRGSTPGWFRSSVAIFLPDITLHDHAESPSAEMAIKIAFARVTQKAIAQQQTQQHRRDNFRKIFNKPDRRTLHVLPKY